MRPLPSNVIDTHDPTLFSDGLYKWSTTKSDERLIFSIFGFFSSSCGVLPSSVWQAENRTRPVSNIAKPLFFFMKKGISLVVVFVFVFVLCLYLAGLPENPPGI